MYTLKYLLAASFILASCKSSSEFSGFSYDPPGVTNTADKVITPQKRRVIGAGNPKVWVSNEFESARLSDFYQTQENKFDVLIQPENAPINNSPWFAFRIWSDTVRTIELTLDYENATHRYIPKIWQSDSTGITRKVLRHVRYDSLNGTASFDLLITPEPIRITAHFPDEISFTDLQQQLDTLNLPFIAVDTAGFSQQGRPVYELTVDKRSSANEKGVLVLVSRQHPPEVSGYRLYQAFFRELIADNELAVRFRNYFVVKAYPIVNPDGVVNGHWRHNATGIDLNRDWQNFNQPETRAVRDALTAYTDSTGNRVFYAIDFHSTNENIFYPINREVQTSPDDLTQRWAAIVTDENPELMFSSEEFDTSSPISKNWVYRRFGADAVTFEVDDELSRSATDSLAKSATRSLMRLLLREYQQQEKIKTF